MTVERALRLIAGVFTVVGAILAATVSPWWLLFVGFVGLNQVQSAFTDWCPMIWPLERAGLARCGKGDSALRSPGSPAPIRP